MNFSESASNTHPRGGVHPVRTMKPTSFIRTSLASLLLPICLCVLAAAGETKPENENSPAAPPPPAQTTNVDPFAEPQAIDRKPAISDERLGVKLPVVLVRLEIWETSAVELAKRLDGITDTKGIEQLREEFLGGKSAGKLIASPANALDPSSSPTSESISERIYPTEYETDELPSTKPDDKNPPAAAISPGKEISTTEAFSSPTSFETRNTGKTFQATARKVTAEDHTWDVAICFESVEHAGDLSYGKPELLIREPLFTTFRVQGTHRLHEGRWQPCSIQTPPKGINGDDSKRWVCLLRVDPLPN